METISVPQVTLVDSSGKSVGVYNDDPGWWQVLKQRLDSNEGKTLAIEFNKTSGKGSPINGVNTGSKTKLITKADSVPDYETNYIYSIGSKMSPLIYTVFGAAGTASIVVNGNTDNIETTFGVTFSQVLSGEDTLIYLSSQYFEVDLADQELQIILTFTRNDNQAYVFPKITAK